MYPDNLSEKLYMRRMPSVIEVMNMALRTYFNITMTS